MGETEIIDELRVLISEEERTTASFTFSSQMRPSLHQFRSMVRRTVWFWIRIRKRLSSFAGKRFTSYAEKFIPPVSLSGQYLGNWMTNMRRFLARDFHMKSGMKYLIESFYRSIVHGAPLPIPYREIVLTARIMDDIFAQLDSQQRGAGSEREVDAHAAG